jgi:hypothetical protein
MIDHESRRRGKRCTNRASAAPRPSGKWRGSHPPGTDPREKELPTGDFIKPLCPLRYDKFNDERYFPLDSSLENYEKFIKHFKDAAEWTSRGQLITVTGGRGYGKTSLMQRCAAWLRDNAKNIGQCEVVPVDLSDEGPAPTMLLGDRVEETADRILEAVAKKMRKEQLEEVKAEPAAAGKIRKLSIILSSRVDGNGKTLPSVIVVALLRSYSAPAEIAEYYNNIMRKGMIFFAEAYEKLDEIRELHPGFNRLEVNALMLELGALKAGDFGGLVQRLQREEPHLPTVPSTMIDSIEKEFIPRRVSAGRLARLAVGVLEIAHGLAATELQQDHLDQYLRDFYLKYAEVGS